MKFRTFLLLFLFITLAVACSTGPVTGPRRFNPAAEPTLVPTSVAVARPVYTIEEGLVIEEMTFEGRISPRQETEIFPPLDGPIQTLLVSEGDLVVAGDPLARYDFAEQDEALRELRQARAEVQQSLDGRLAAQEEALVRANLELDLATLELEVAESNGDPAPGSVAEKERQLLTLKVEAAQTDLDEIERSADPDGQLTAELQRLDEEIQLAEAELEVRSIRATQDGTILALSMSPGQSVAVERPIAIIGEMGGADDLSIAAVLRSDDLEKLSEGMGVSLSFVSQPDQTYAGTLARLPYPHGVGGTQLGFDDADQAVRILPDDLSLFNRFNTGERVTVSVVVAQNESALWLPPQAIREFSGRTFIVVQDGPRQQRIDITPGLRGEGRVEVIGPPLLQAGVEVVGP